MASEALLFIGTLNRETPYFQGARGDGLYVFGFDEDTLRFTKKAHYPGIDNPTFLSVTADGRAVYVNSEVAEWREGLVTALSCEAGTGALTYLNTQPSLGSITAHNAITEGGKRLSVVNYTVGEGGPDRSLALFDIGADGSLAPAGASVSHQGQGPNPARQERAHAHSVIEIPDGTLIVADLGMDALVSYRIAGDGKLHQTAISKTRAGAGPRHMALHPSGLLLFVINELDSTLTSWRYDAQTGALAAADRISTLPASGWAETHCSDLQISGDGRFLYGANRGHDSIVQVAIDATSGRLRICGHTPCAGQTPRHMALSPSGRHLLVANQNSNHVTVLKRDAETGMLTDSGCALNIGTPMCLKFAISG